MTLGGRSQLSGPGGAYSFTELPAGEHTVAHGGVAGLSASTPTSGPVTVRYTAEEVLWLQRWFDAYNNTHGGALVAP